MFTFLRCNGAMAASSQTSEIPDWRKFAFAGFVLLLFSYQFTPFAQVLDFAAIPVSGHVIGGDYPVFWLAAREVMQGHAVALYDPAAFKALAIAAFGPDFNSVTWLYPPHALLLLAPPAMLPFGLGWLTLIGGSFLLFIAIAQMCFPRTPNFIFALMISPCVIGTILAGQTGFLASALLLGGLVLIERKPILAGVLIGCLTIKPQLGLLIPFILVASGAWRALAAAIVTTIILVALSAAIFGLDAWGSYFAALTGGDSTALLEYAVHKPGATLTSLYGLARYAGLPPGLAFALQGLVAIAAACTAVLVARSKADAAAKGVAFVALSYCVSSYLMIYDFPALGAVAAALALGGAGRLSIVDRIVAWAAYATPLVQFATGWTVAPLGSLVVPIFAAFSAWRVFADRELGSAVSHPPLSEMGR
ncbi:hypothetical protein BH10PSE7_BH10PSE7_03290 [soil metagenome]